MTRAAVHARAGLVGHPSDGYGGATLAVTLRDFRATATVTPARERHDADDPLTDAALKRFEREFGPLPHPVRIRFDTTIPRECGLGGSSAIVIATLRALAGEARVELDEERLPRLALACETQDLGIVAGLQDRIVQTLGGLVFMDFARDEHEPLPAALLPPLFVAYRESSGAASGAAHADVRARFHHGDAAVTNAMRELAGLAHDARRALERRDHAAFAAALAAGYDVRARIFALDPRHTAMIAAARALGLAATYTGSGGAIVGVCDDPDKLRRLSSAEVTALPARV